MDEVAYYLLEKLFERPKCESTKNVFNTKWQVNMDLKSVHEIFTNRILKIPSYQRGYSWSNNSNIHDVEQNKIKYIRGQLMDLWNDIINIPENSWHYTGLLTLVEVDKKDYEWLPNHKQYAIVDGQQRITSILILIAVMVEESKRLGLLLGFREGDINIQYLFIKKEGLYAYIFGYDQDNPSDKYFRRHILKIDGIEDDSKESVYTENLKSAKTFFEFMVNIYVQGDRNRLAQLFKKVTSDLKLNEYVLPKELDQYVVFETMNNRGKPLSELEKLKNRLMYLNDKFEISHIDDGHEENTNKNNLLEAIKKDIEDSINTAWSTIYQSLGSNKQAPLDDEDFIKNHWIVYFDRYRRSEAEVYANFIFNEYFIISQVYARHLRPNDIKIYITSLQKCSIIWNKIHNPDFFDTDETDWKKAILGLARVGFRASFKPLVMAILNRHNEPSLIKIITLLESYAFKLFHISDRQSNTGDSKLYRLANGIYTGNVDLQSALNEIKSHIDYYYSFSLFLSQIQELFETETKLGFYRWSGLKYFLFEYDHKLRTKNNTTTQTSQLEWKDFYRKDSIEHIYPQSAAKSYEEYCEGNDTSEARIAYEKLQQDWRSFSHFSNEERKRFCGSLGNLLAISKDDNASFSNDPFKYKVDQSNKGDSYRNRGYRYDSMSAQIVATVQDWTPETIMNRGILMLDAMLDLLGEKEDLLDYNKKLTLLGLEFMVQKKNSAEEIKMYGLLNCKTIEESETLTPYNE